MNIHSIVGARDALPARHVHAGIHRLSRVAAFFLLVSAASGMACGSRDTDAEASAGSELRALAPNEMVGDISFGESRTVDYADVPLYRALRVKATKGDVLDAWVRGPGVDARAWIVTSTSRTLASNDDASATTRDAHVQAKVNADGDYFIVLREKNGEDGTFTVSLAGAVAPTPVPTAPPTPTAPSQPMDGLAALPDGVYRIPATSYLHTTSATACQQRLDVYTVTKNGTTFTVGGGPNITTEALTGVGAISTGAFSGKAIYDPCSYCPDSHKTVYDMSGTLSYTAGRLSLSAFYSGSWTTGRSWSGSITTTLFGQNESTLPPGVRRAALRLGPRYDGCGWLWDVTVVRLADGTRMMSLPSYLGDVAVDAQTWTQFGCARRPAGVTLQGNVVSTNQSLPSSSCGDEATVPDWFAQ